MKTHVRHRRFPKYAYCGSKGPFFVARDPDCLVCAKRDARHLAAVVREALTSYDCQRWRDKSHPQSFRWDDGPCFYVAKAISVVDGHRGQIMEVRAGAHAVYVLHGIAIDGHGLYKDGCKPRPLNWHYGRSRAKKPWAINWSKWTPGVGPPATLIRAIRRELHRSASAS